MIRLVITPGDPDGIGPEIVWETLRSGFFKTRPVHVLFVGAAEPFVKLRAKVKPSELPARLARPFDKSIPLLTPPTAPSNVASIPGFQAGWSIQAAARLVLTGKADALITGPIHKERLQAGGFHFPGHTEFLEHLCNPSTQTGTQPDVTMMLANSELRVSLVTTHLALKDVPQAITPAEIRRTVLHTHDFLKNRLRFKKPRIAITSLNPHGGEGGLFGREEIEVLLPTLRQLNREGFAVEGPFPADTFFAKHVMTPPKKRHDAVVAMYHDQGLTPVKLIDFKRTVNITLGLPMIRTSVDHGVGFDIVGKQLADPSSFQAAVDLAIELAKKGRKQK